MGVREDDGDVEATGAFHVHEIRVWGLYETLEFVRTTFLFDGRMQQIDGEDHGCDERTRKRV